MCTFLMFHTGRFEFQTFFSDRFFDIFDTAKTGTLDIQEFTEGAALLAKGDAKVKLRFLFQVYDVDGKNSEHLNGISTGIGM